MEKTPENEAETPKKKRGAPRFKPTARHREDVMLFKAAGLSEPGIAAALKISQNTLRKYFAGELDVGRDVKRAENLRWMAKAAKKGNVAAQRTLHAMFDQGEKSELLQDPDVGQAAASTAEDKVRQRLTKKELVTQDAVNAGVGTEWADDLPPVRPN